MKPLQVDEEAITVKVTMTRTWLGEMPGNGPELDLENFDWAAAEEQARKVFDDPWFENALSEMGMIGFERE